MVIQICTAALVHCVAMLFMSGFGNSDVTFSCMIFKTAEYAPWYDENDFVYQAKHGISY